MRKNTYLSLLFICLFLFVSKMQSQEIVINEYSNFDKGWVELVVVQDNLDIRNYELRDNVNNNKVSDAWAGGVKFKSIALWSRLRAGTVIVINSRGASSIDTDPSDGYLELSAEDVALFDKKVYSSFPANQWPNIALVYESESDIVQILNAAGQNVHSFANLDNTNGSTNFKKGLYKDIVGAKIAHNSNKNSSFCIAMVPGARINDFSLSGDAFDSGNSLTHSFGIVDSKGTANLNSSMTPSNNYIFWRKLREPKWIDPVVKFTTYLGKITLTWNKMEDDFSDDGMSGYIVIRIKESDLATLTPPQDGMEYKVGQSMGLGLVIAIANKSNTLNVEDLNAAECGISYIYRVYPFRFKNPANKNFTVEQGIGIDYNTANDSYAEVRALRKLPSAVRIVVEKNKQTLCSNDTITLSTNLIDSKKYKFRWTKNGITIGQQGDYGKYDSIDVYAPGDYQVEIENEEGCKIKSNIEPINVIANPDATIRDSKGFPFTKDTTILLCTGEKFVLQTSTSANKAWYKNTDIINTNDYNISINSNGVYKLIANYNQKCYDTSANITIKYVDYNLSFDKQTLKFFITGTETFDIQTLEITNDTDEEIILDKSNFIFNPEGDYTIQNVFPIKIPAKGKYLLNIKFFATLLNTLITCDLTIQTPCGKSYLVKLEGTKFKGNGRLDFSENKIDFGYFSICQRDTVQRTLTIFNNSNEDMTITSTSPTLPFELLTNNFPLTLKQNSSTDFKVQIKSPATVATYKDSLLINVKTATLDSTVRILLFAETDDEKFQILKNDLIFPDLTGCQFSYLDSFAVRNLSKVPIRIKDNNPESIFTIQNLPQNIDAGKTATVYVEFKPSSSSTFSLVKQILSENCKVLNTINFQGRKNGELLFVDKDTVNFDTLYICDNKPYTFEKTLNLSFASNDGSMATIDSFHIDLPFSTDDIKQGDSFNGVKNVSVKFPKQIAGDYEGKLYIKSQPCNVERIIILKAVQIDLDKLQSTFNSTIGVIETFETKTSAIQLNLNNVFASDILVKSFTQDNSNFKLLNTVPMTLIANNQHLFEFEYLSNKIGKDSVEFTFTISKPCDLIFKVKIIVNNNYDPSKIAKINFKKISNLDVIASRNYQIKYNLESLGQIKLDDIAIDSLKMNISYERNAFIINSISSSNFSTFVLNDNQNGKFQLTMKNIDNSKIDKAELAFDIHTLWLPGSTSLFTIDSIQSFADPRLKIENDKDIIITQSLYCPLDSNMKFDGVAKLNFSANFINKENAILLDYDVITDDKIEITIWDVLGNNLAVLQNSSKETGNYSEKINIESLPNGIYFLTYQSLGIYKFIKLIKDN